MKHNSVLRKSILSFTCIFSIMWTCQIKSRQFKGFCGCNSSNKMHVYTQVYNCYCLAVNAHIILYMCISVLLSGKQPWLTRSHCSNLVWSTCCRSNRKIWKPSLAAPEYSSPVASFWYQTWVTRIVCYCSQTKISSIFKNSSFPTNRMTLR